MSPSENTILVCYCVNGHQVIPNGMRVPACCDQCGAPMDPQRLFVPAPGNSSNQSTPGHEEKITGTEIPEQKSFKHELPFQNTPDALSEPKSDLIPALEYFGERIKIPQNGGWIGRTGIGQDLFAGNRLISRKHVFVQPLGNGRLRVGPNQSLNGVFVRTNQDKSELEENQIVELRIGDILWLYNVPLLVVSEENAR